MVLTTDFLKDVVLLSISEINMERVFFTNWWTLHVYLFTLISEYIIRYFLQKKKLRWLPNLSDCDFHSNLTILYSYLYKEQRKQCPVVDVIVGGRKVQFCKNKITEEPGMRGPWIKVNWKWSKRRQQDWTLTFRNQWIKMVWKGKFNSDYHYI